MVNTTEALYLTPQTITGQIEALEERLQGKLFKQKGRGLEPSELGELVFRYTDRMFALNWEMLDTVDYRKESSLSFDIGVMNALLKQLINSVLDVVMVEGGQICLRCFKSAHEMLLDQLGQHKLDMIISDCPTDSTQQERSFPVRIDECSVSLWHTKPLSEKSFLACLEERRLLIPRRHSMLGRRLLNWINPQGLNVEILGEFDDATLMKAFGVAHDVIFIASTLYSHNFYAGDSIAEVGRIEDVMEEYHAMFVERMIQHPAMQRIYDADYSVLFRPQQTYLP